MLDLQQLFGLFNYSMIDINVMLCNVYLKVVLLVFGVPHVYDEIGMLVGI
jgi:hypothetical protein